MKVMNWAKEKIKALSDWHGRKTLGEIPRFNKVAPIVQAPNREQRKEHRYRLKFHRWATMRVGGGTRVKASGCNACNPHDLLVQPRYRRSA
jgi:hypothetical protein